MRLLITDFGVCDNTLKKTKTATSKVNIIV